MNTDPIPDDLVEIAEAADLARCHVSTVYRWCLGASFRPARLRCWKRAGRYFVSRAELLGLFEQVKPKGAPAPDPAPTARQEAEYQAWKAATLERAGLKRKKG